MASPLRNDARGPARRLDSTGGGGSCSCIHANTSSQHIQPAKYTIIEYFTQNLDHFDPTDARTWKHRYLVNADNWDGRGRLPNGCKGPVLLYTGNEGPITTFWGANGFMIDVLAPKLGALRLLPLVPMPPPGTEREGCSCHLLWASPGTKREGGRARVSP